LELVEIIHKFVNEWSDYKRALAVHMTIEDNGLFNLLDHVGDEVVSREGLRGEHAQDVELQNKIDSAIADEDLTRLQQSFDHWSTDHLAHLEHEEKVMMPLIPRTGKGPISLGQAVHEHLISPMGSNSEFDWAVGWIVDKLNRFGSTDQSPNVAVRVFVWGLHYAANKSQWQRWLPIIKENVSDEIFQKMIDIYRIDRPGRIGAITKEETEFNYLPTDSPRPMSFGIMRNCHEAFRVSIRNMRTLFENDLNWQMYSFR
jgi:hypothetical protein